MGGKTSAAVKNKYNRANYDIINLTLPKGNKETLQAIASKHGQSTNEFIRDAINAKIDALDNGKGNTSE